MIGFLVVNAGLQWVWPCCCGFLWFFFRGYRPGFIVFTPHIPRRHRIVTESLPSFFFLNILVDLFASLSLSLSLCLSLFVLLLFTEWFISGCRSGWSASGFHGRIPPLTPATGPWLFWACVIDPLLSFLSFFFFSLSFSLFVFFRFRPSPQRRQCASLAPLSTLIGH